MRKISKYPLYILTVVLTILTVSIVSSAAMVNDFSLSYSADLNDNILTVGVDITVPSSDGDTTSCVFSTFYVNDTQLKQTADSYSSSPTNAELGQTCWINSSAQAWYNFVNTKVAPDAYAGGTVHFEIKFDVSDVDVKVGDTLTIGPSKTNRIATWNGSGVTVDEGTVLATCVITGSGSTSGNDSTLTASNFTAPTDTYFTDAGITVTPSTTDLSFTVASQDDKACVVAKVNEDGTYTVLPATTNDGVHTYTAGSADDQIIVAVKGDVDGNGSINVFDVLKIIDNYSNNSTFTSLQSVAGDVDGSSLINVFDVLKIIDAYNGIALSW